MHLSLYSMFTSINMHVFQEPTIHVYYRSKVWGHPDNLKFSMKTHTFIFQINFRIKIKYSKDIDEVINNDFYCKY